MNVSAHSREDSGDEPIGFMLDPAMPVGLITYFLGLCDKKAELEGNPIIFVKGCVMLGANGIPLHRVERMREIFCEAVIFFQKQEAEDRNRDKPTDFNGPAMMMRAGF